MNFQTGCTVTYGIPYCQHRMLCGWCDIKNTQCDYNNLFTEPIKWEWDKNQVTCEVGEEYSAGEWRKGD